MKESKMVISHIKAGFGNQLFQYATGYAMAKRIGATYKLDLSHYTGKRLSQFKLGFLNLTIEEASPDEIALLKNEEPAPFLFKGLNKFGLSSRYRKASHINETFGFQVDHRILNRKKSSYLFGWCTVLAYFDNVKADLQSLFTMKGSFSSQAQKYLQKIQDSESVALHIRRGDYVELDHFFKVLDIAYYEEARDLMVKKLSKPRFFIFSNDLEWVKQELSSWKVSLEFVDLNFDGAYIGQGDIEEFFLMKECKHFIIANSSFSWWPAYLKPGNKEVISPKVWYNDNTTQNSFAANPLIEKNWTQI